MTGIRLLNEREVIKAIEGLAQKQMPFAASLALNETAQDAKNAVTKQIEKKLDRPTRFTLNAVGVRRASKRNLKATVFIKDIQAEYLQYAIEGGTRKPKDKALVVPRDIRLNKYGNIPGLRGGKKIAALLNKPNTFMGTIKGQSGIWQRTNKNKRLKLLLAFEDKIEYRKRLDFHKIVVSVAKNRLQRNLKRALEYAVRTAR